MATKKKDGRKTKRFALRASVNGTNHWESLTDEQKQERINRMQAGRKKWQEKKEQIIKPRSLSLVEGNKMVDGWINKKLQHDEQIDWQEEKKQIDAWNDYADELDTEKIADFNAMTAFKRVATHKRARALVVRLKELCLEEDGVEPCADNEFVGISWLHLQALVYKIMKEMDDE